MKMEKSVIYVKKNLKINIWKIKNIAKLEIIVIIHRCAACRIYNLKYSVHKKFSIVAHNGSNFDYHFIIKELAEVTRSNKNVEEINKRYILRITIY